jgi:hypothetical protein
MSEPLSGWLFKRGEKGIIKSYKRRWFRQVRNQIFYFESATSTEALGSIDLSVFTLGKYQQKKPLIPLKILLFQKIPMAFRFILTPREDCTSCARVLWKNINTGSRDCKNGKLDKLKQK